MRSKEIKIPGRITISRMTGGDGLNPVRIVIEDNRSRIRVLELGMTLEDFAKALMNQGSIPCELEVTQSSNIGKYPISKVVFSEDWKPNYITATQSDVRHNRNILAEKIAEQTWDEKYEDGWTVHSHQLGNYHYKNKEGKFPITLVKYVDEKPEDWED